MYLRIYIIPRDISAILAAWALLTIFHPVRNLYFKDSLSPIPAQYECNPKTKKKFILNMDQQKLSISMKNGIIPSAIKNRILDESIIVIYNISGKNNLYLM